MKRILITVSVLFFCVAAVAQKMEIKGLGSFKSSWLFNKSVSDKGDDQDYSAAWGWNYGVGYAFYINDHVGFELDLLMNTHKGGYSGMFDSAGTAKTYESHTTISTLDLPLLFKFRSETGAFFEIGAQYSVVQEANFFYTGYKSNPLSVNRDVTADYASKNISAVMGFGIRIGFGKHIGMITGMRFEYGLSDFKGVDGIGAAFNNPFYYKEYNGTSNAAAGLFLGLSFGLGGDKEDTGSSTTPATN